MTIIPVGQKGPKMKTTPSILRRLQSSSYPDPFGAALVAGLLTVVPGTTVGASFTGLGFLPNSQASYARSVSAGGIVVGESMGSTAPEGAQAFHWTESGGMTGIGFLPGGKVSLARAISSDGTAVFGSGDFNDSAYWGISWSATGVENLGWVFNYPRAVSADGSVAVGTGASMEVGQSEQACRWTTLTGRVLLGVLPGGSFSDGFGVSADGSVVVGTSDSPGGFRAFRWTAADGMTSLGFLPGHQSSEGRGISADGSTIVGVSYNSVDSEPFRWTQAGGMQGLGHGAPGDENATALAVSGDGAVIVGFYQPWVAYVWDENHGMRNLQDVLTQRYGINLTGWGLQEAVAISADARILVGNGMHDGRPEGWIARVEDLTLPELSINKVADELVVSWPAPSPGWRLEAATGLADGSAWTEIPGPYPTGDNRRISFRGALPDGNRYYRLAKP